MTMYPFFVLFFVVFVPNVRFVLLKVFVFHPIYGTCGILG